MERALITDAQKRHLLAVRIVAALAAIVGAVVVVLAFLQHWVLGLVALFFLPAAVFLAVTLFEAVVRPPD